MESQETALNEDDRGRKRSVVYIPQTPSQEFADSKGGLLNCRAFFFLILWYFFSGCTLFMNKYILEYMKADPTLLGTFQMLMTGICGFVQLYFPCGMYKPHSRLSRPPGFYRHMVIVGCTRFMTVILGLISLNYVAVSFTETIKSSAPIFTVVISRVLLGEVTSLWVNLSLIPVMGGLALCSVNELSFDTRGFIAAMATNFTECLQNVYSKMLISGEKFRYTPAELQFYTSLASVALQVPASLFYLQSGSPSPLGPNVIFAFILNGVFFHFQSITAYVLMNYTSPLTHSVVNTVKRALLIWASVVFFGNEVTALSALGTGLVIAGVLLYNRAVHMSGSRKPMREVTVK